MSRDSRLDSRPKVFAHELRKNSLSARTRGELGRSVPVGGDVFLPPAMRGRRLE